MNPGCRRFAPAAVTRRERLERERVYRASFLGGCGPSDLQLECCLPIVPSWRFAVVAYLPAQIKAVSGALPLRCGMIKWMTLIYVVQHGEKERLGGDLGCETCGFDFEQTTTSAVADTSNART